MTGGDSTALFQASILEDNSDPGYCLRAAPAEAERFFAARKLTAPALRTVRLLLHGVLTIGGIIGEDGWADTVAKTINADYSTEEFGAGPAAFYWAHFKQDWGFVRELLDVNDEECALLLHETILRAAGDDEESDEEEEEEEEEEAAEGEGPRGDEQEQDHEEEREQEEDGEGQAERGREEGDEEEPAEAEVRRRARAQEQVAMLQEELRALEQQAADLPEGEIRPGHPLVDDIVEVRAALGEAMARLGHGPGGMMRGPGGMPEGAAVAEEEAVPGLLRTPEERGAWEAALVDALGTLLAGEGKGARLREIEARYTDAHDEGAVFKDELQERTDVGALNEAVRLAAYPGLWRYRRPFTFEQFQASFAREPRLAEEYPVLSELLTRQSELRALRYLPQLFRWLELLMYVLQLPSFLCSALP